MIEILLGLWIICGLITLCLALLNIYLLRKKLNLAEVSILNQNLAKINSYWSYTQGNCLKRDNVNSFANDQKLAFSQSYKLCLLALFSLPGLIIMLLAFFGIHFLASNRLEQKVFKSPLVSNPNLSEPEVNLILDQVSSPIDSIVPKE